MVKSRSGDEEQERPRTYGKIFAIYQRANRPAKTQVKVRPSAPVTARRLSQSFIVCNVSESDASIGNDYCRW